MSGAARDSYDHMTNTTNHRELRAELLDDLQHLQIQAERLGLTQTLGQIRELRKRLAEQTFAIAVVGEFNRGKSTFINALIGEEILPASIFPATATLNRVTYGHEKKVRVYFKEGHGTDSPAEIPIESLAEYVTKLTDESENVAATVEEAVVHYPVPICRIFNMDIIDTPGLNDEADLSQVTLDALQKVDAAILVFFGDAAFAESEGQFLERLLDCALGKVIFCVTALDRVRRVEDRQRILDDVTRRVGLRIRKFAEAKFGDDAEAGENLLRRLGEPRVFGISGQLALDGKRTNNANLLRESRFAEFEDGLRQILTDESEAVALRARTGQVYTLCRQLYDAAGEKMSAAEGRRSRALQRSRVGLALIELLQQMGRAELRRLADMKESFLSETQKIGGWTAGARTQNSWNLWRETAGAIAQHLHRYAVTLELLLGQAEAQLAELGQQTGPTSLTQSAAGFLKYFGGQKGFGPDERLGRVWEALGIREERFKDSIKTNQLTEYVNAAVGRVVQTLDSALGTLPEMQVRFTAVVERQDAAAEHELATLGAAQSEAERFERKWQVLLGSV